MNICVQFFLSICFTYHKSHTLLKNSRSGAVPTIPAGDDPEKHLEKLEQESEKTQGVLQECRKRRREIKDELRTVTKKVKALEIQMPKLKLEISGCDTTREELTKLIPELREQCHVSDEDTKKRAELEKNVGKCRSDMSSCAKLATKFEKEVSKLQKDILDAGGPRLKNQKEACGKVVSRLNEAEKTLNSSRVEVVSSEKAEAKAKVAKEELEKQLENCETLLTDKETEFKALEEGALEVMTAYDKVKVVEAEKRSALENASKEVEILKESQSEIKCIEIDLVGQMEAHGKQISDCKKKIHHWEKEIKKLREVEDEDDYEGDVDGLDEPSDGPTGEDMDVETQEKNEVDEDGDGKTDVAESKSYSLKSLPHAALEKYDPEDIKETISTLESERNLLAKNANMGAIAEYRKKEADYLSRYVFQYFVPYYDNFTALTNFFLQYFSVLPSWTRSPKRGMKLGNSMKSFDVNAWKCLWMGLVRLLSNSKRCTK